MLGFEGPVRAACFGAATVAVLLVPFAARATCTATRCCNCSSCATPGCHAVTGIPPNITKAECDKAQQDFVNIACVQLNCSCSAPPCQCSSGAAPTSPTSPSPSPITTTGAVAAFPPLGTPALQGPEQGSGFLSQHPLSQRADAARDATNRGNAARSRSSPTSIKASAQSRARAAAYDFAHNRRHRTPGCFSFAVSSKLAFFRTLPSLAEPAAPSPLGDTWPPLSQEPLPMIAIDDGRALPESPGAGVRTGERDKPPPPNPQPVNQPTECKKAWWFNRETKTCYSTSKSCEAAFTTPEWQRRRDRIACYQPQP